MDTPAQTASQSTRQDPLVIAGRAYASRLLTGTGKYKEHG